MELELHDKEELVRKRQRRAIAASLSNFETLIEPHLPKNRETRALVAQYKADHRKMIEDLANDAIDFMSLTDGIRVNGEALHLRDVLRVRPHEVRNEIGAAAA